MPFAFGQDQDHLEAGRVADVLEQDRGPLGLLEPLINGLDRLGSAEAALGAAALAMADLARRS